HYHYDYDKQDHVELQALLKSLPCAVLVSGYPSTLYDELLPDWQAIEMVNREIKRRTHVATLFPNEASCLRLVTAVAMSIPQDWRAGRRCLNLREGDSE